ncbi:MAG: hypothetical protein KJ000_27920 [Pirellulaceae bacterium]|nr:hypothetical protein [Pirellulaceae bacterium]
MAAKFIELNEAAKQLGVTADQLNDMRLRGEIFGTRDGSTWKFKAEEVERVAEERSGGSLDSGDDDALSFDSDINASSSDLQLESEGVASDSPTAIGAMDDFDDLGVTSDDDLRLAPEASSDVSLVTDGDGSSVNLVADSGNDILGGSGLAVDAGGTGDLDFEGSDLSIGSDLSFEDDAKVKPKPAALGAELTVDDDDELALSDDDELVLEGSGDITGGSGESGINLTSPSDSGLNLEEEPMDLAGSSVSSLELPEDDDIIDLDDLDAGADEATQLKADEDFQLAPSAMMGDEDEEDSGSQVIALEDSEAFTDAAGMLVGDDEAEPVLGKTEDELDGALDEYQASPGIQPAAGMAYAPLPEAPYSIWNIIALLTIFVILGLTGMLMADLIRNMWSWTETFTASTPIMDMMVKLVGLEP